MKKYKLPLFLFLLGILVTFFAELSLGNFNGLFVRILNFFSISQLAHLAWMMLFVNAGLYILYTSFLFALGISLRSVLNAPLRFDKWILGLSTFLIIGIFILWTLDGSFPVPFNTLQLLGH